jgi:hypothetical protein
MRVFLDDERTTPEGWVRAYTVPQLIGIFKANTIEELSLDHHLGLDQQTGYDFMRWLEAEVFADRVQKIPDIYFHTADFVGRAKMQQALDSINRILDAKAR